jgi:hypothetical protein
VREAAEVALQASQSEVAALGAKMRRTEKRRRRLQSTMEGIAEATQDPLLTHGAPMRHSS